MKTKKNLLVACFVGLALTFGIAGTAVADLAAGTGIAGSKHDMTSVALSGTTTETRICAFCHTPHHAEMFAGQDYMPLWSRPDMGATGFAQYDSATFDAANIDGIGDITDPMNGPTRLCMSCHDGVVAIDSYYGSTGTLTSVRDDDTWGGISIVDGFGLSNDHPVGFDYIQVAAQDDEIIATPTFASSGVAVADVLYADQTFVGEMVMTCSTCHDVHNTKNTEDYFLYETNDGSALCLTCHDK